MKKRTFFAVAALIGVFLLGADLARALEPIPDESGFSGFVRPGVGYMSFKTNLVASFLGFDLSEKKNDSLNDSPDSESTAIALIPFSVAYTFASTRTQVFLGTDIVNLIRFDYSQQLGVKQGIGSFGILQAGYLFSSIPAKVWKDPYLVNQNRSDTKRNSNGLRLTWDRIFNTQLQVQFTYRNIDISSERSGDSLGFLTSNDRDRLKRDGDQYGLEVLYRFDITEKHRLTPAFTYTLDDRDGDAMSSDTYDIQLTYGYSGDPFTVIVNGFIGWADYDKKNPIYDKTQDDDRFGVNAQIYYTNPWGWTLLNSKPMQFYISAAYIDIDSNIDFYDQEAIFTTVGVGFRW
ncbi:MAG: DUF2860 family protein [Syntrophobacterales bacterium]|jgi:hypothetical protein